MEYPTPIDMNPRQALQCMASERVRTAAPILYEASILTLLILRECFGADPNVVAESNPAIAGVMRLQIDALKKAGWTT